MGPATSNRRGGQSLTVLDEAVTVLDDPPVQLRVRGLSVGWGGGWEGGTQLDLLLRGQPQ